MSLFQYFNSNVGLPINKWVHYIPIYERYFAPFRDRRALFLEIGAGQGGSSRMWKHYFGPLVQIVSIDVREECSAFQDEQVSVRIGDQSDPLFLQRLIDEFGPPDVVLDDGSHQMDHVNAAFSFLYPRLSRDAVYMVEDMHTSYWPAWGGGLKRSGTFIERMKDMIDELHGENPHNAEHGAMEMPSSEISRLTRGIHFYDSIVVVEKGNFVSKIAKSIPLIEGRTIW